jgi:hypothetical protein
MSPITLAFRSVALVLMVGLRVASPASSKKQHFVDWQRHGGDAAGNQLFPVSINTRMFEAQCRGPTTGKRADNRSQINVTRLS